MEFLIFGVAAAVAILLLYLAWKIEEQRRLKLRGLAQSMGWQYSPHDSLGLLGLPFPIFSRGSSRKVSNVLWGPRGDHELRVFEYQYKERRTNSRGQGSTTTYRFTCASTQIDVAAPHTSIERETLLSRLADVAGFRDIEFESEEFNRHLQVKSADERFATYLIDPRMMEWLLHAGPWSFELTGPFVLARLNRRLKPEELPRLIDAIEGFTARVPRVLYDVYGGAG
ncbi:MAG TPA: hypothetical protein VGB83_07440 [Actinomycetota bacterium]